MYVDLDLYRRFSNLKTVIIREFMKLYEILLSLFMHTNIQILSQDLQVR